MDTKSGKKLYRSTPGEKMGTKPAKKLYRPTPEKEMGTKSAKKLHRPTPQRAQEMVEYIVPQKQESAGGMRMPFCLAGKIRFYLPK